MKIIRLEASSWREPDDFYSTFLPQLGAPDWHGRNLDALYDSLCGGINELEPPFRVIIAESAMLEPDMTAFLDQVAEVFDDVQKRWGREVELECR